MGSEENNEMGFHQNGNNNNNESIQLSSNNVSEIAMSSVSNNPFIASSSNWDPLVSFGGSSMVVSHSDFVNSNSSSHSHYPLVLENSNSQFVQFVSDSNLGGNFSSKVHHSFGSGSFSEMVVGSLGDFRAHSMNVQQSQIEDSAPQGSAPSGNSKKRGLDHNKNAEGDALKDSPGKSSDDPKEHEKKAKVEQNASADSCGKQSAKQAKDSSQSGEAPKENFIHVRARRGQATNSHSLAERVRREKISERMRLLQELVPGCNKITGKAVMLDEIINYVQSLQQQVEFLSMKLATVNPELNFDVERILSKDILQTRIGHGIGGYGGMSSSHPPFPSGNFQGAFSGMPSTSTQFPPLPQAVLDHEFQSFYGMGFDSSTTLDNLGPNGRLKTEL